MSLTPQDYAISPVRDGCCLTASIAAEDNALAIVAVRVLVGSMADLVPREIGVMGTGCTMKLKKNAKRWYDL